MFAERETEYMGSQPLVRLGTASVADQPDVSAVGFDFDGEFFYVGGMALEASRKYKNILAHSKVALLFDDLASVDPWRPRSVRVYGTADTVKRPGYMGDGEYIRIKPDVHWSIGVEGEGFVDGKPQYKRVKHA